MTTWYSELPDYAREELWKIAKHLFWPGKGIMGADESISTLQNRFKCAGLVNDEETRRQWRQLLFTVPDLEQYISGVILHPETVLQSTDGGVNFIKYLKSRGIVPGVKLDAGTVPLTGSLDEPTTVGLEDLAEKCDAFKKAGIYFAKWRVVYRITKQTPTFIAIDTNARNLARFASICQKNRLVPIIEPDVEQDGSHGLIRMQKVTETVLAAVIKALHDHHVFLEGAILKVNFVTPGMRHPNKYTAEEMAEATIEAFQRTVPSSMMGICFLAGSLREDEATDLMNAIATAVTRKYLTFSFSRGLHMSTMVLWRGNEENVEPAQQHLLERLKKNQMAVLGKLKKPEEWLGPVEDGEFFVRNHPFYTAADLNPPDHSSKKFVTRNFDFKPSALPALRAK